MPQLKISLLGSFRVALDNQPVTGFEYNKVRALLAYLAVEGDTSHSRGKLAGLLWPDMPETTALSNLRYALADLRTVIGDRAAQPAYLKISRQNIQFNTSSHTWLDVRAMEALIETSEGSTSDLTPLIQATETYRGNFLEGFAIPDSIAFEEWLLLKREHYHQLALKALQRLSDYYELAGNYEQAQNYAARQLELDPWLEEAHRQLMRLMAYREQRSQAIAQFETCKKILAEALGVEPAKETLHLYEQIRDSTFSVPPRPPAFLWEVQPGIKPRPLFVSREAELERMDRTLERVLRGEGQPVFVIGDPGRGKTALVDEFLARAQVTHPDIVVVKGNGQAYFGAGDPYLPFREVLEMLTGEVEDRWAAGSVSREHAHRLWLLAPDATAAIVEHGPALVDTFLSGQPLLTRASQATLGESDWINQLGEIIKSHAQAPPGPGPTQEDLFHQYSKVLQTIARQRPLLVFLDDLQWVDRGSLDLFFYLGRQLTGARILIIGAFRPEEILLEDPDSRQSLAALSREFQMVFGDIFINLDEPGGQDFLNAYLDSEPYCLEEAFRGKLYHQTRGHPLFTIELLRGMQEHGELFKNQDGEWVESPPINWDRLPPKVEAAIAVRLSRLPQSLMELLQVACVEGERFTAEAIAHVLDMNEELVVNHLSGELDRKYKLVRAESTGYVDGKGYSRYRFHHLLVQRYLYQGLDRVIRPNMHHRVGEALEQLYGEHRAEFAVRLARHFQEANIPNKAIEYLTLAGNRALRLSANEEAITHISRALELLENLPPSSDHDLQELNLLNSLSVALMMARGLASPELGRVCDRAREIIQNSEGKPEYFHMSFHLGSYFVMRAEYSKGLSLARQVLQYAKRYGDPLQTLLMNWPLGYIFLRFGDFEKSLFHFEEVIGMYDFEGHRELAYIYGHDPLGTCLAWSTWDLWMLGYPARAKERSQEAINHTFGLSHPPSHLLALNAAAHLHLFSREVETALDLIEAITALVLELKPPYWLATIAFLHGWGLIEMGQVKDGLAEMEKGLDDYRMIGTRDILSLYLSQLAMAYAQAGRIDEGLERLREAEAFIQETGERLYEPEMLRIKGDILLKRSQANQDEAENCFRKAKQLAIQCGAKSWELRAALSLGRILQQAGKQQEARQQLGETYAWFNEGFETPDLRAAKEILEALSPN